MSKLSSYSEEEKRAVFDQVFGDTPIQFEDMTDKQLHNLMNSWNGSQLVMRMRVRKLGQEFKRVFYYKVKDNRITLQATADAYAAGIKDSLVVVIQYADDQKSIYFAGRRIR